MKIKILIVSSIICSILGEIHAQDSSFRQSPSGLTIAEGKLGFVKLRSDFIDANNTKEAAAFTGFGASFTTNLFRRENEAKQFRHADYEGLGMAVGLGSKGFWLNGKFDLGYQLHYAPHKKIDIGFRVFGTAITDKIPFLGIMFQPSLKLGSIYLDYCTGINISIQNSLPRTYSEFNFRFLFPNDESYDMDRWYLGFKAITFTGTNNNSAKTTTRMSQGFLTVGLML